MRAMIRSKRRRPYLIASAVFTLGLLAIFKYAALAIETFAPIFAGAFGLQIPMPEIFLPLGISFYSFQILALSIDVYREEIPPPPSFARYALFISFFPQLIAGPILRGREFLPQLERGGEPTPARSRRGIWLIGSGLFKKVVIADFLLAPFVDSIFAAPGVGSIGFHVVAIWSFAFQIYFDFSGYSDMARGLGLLLGFELPFNFLEPYLSRNPAEFWRRWHITLSRWLRDYLYILLGGNRGARSRTYVNLMLTMLLGGLWHGAAWNFVIWGGLHGLLLAVHRRFAGRGGDSDAPLVRGDAVSIIVLFNAVCLIWIFFRAPDFASAMQYIGAIFAGHGLAVWPVAQLGIVAFCAVLHLVERQLRTHCHDIQAALSRRPWGAIAEGCSFGTIVALAIAASGIGGEFIYFQF
jgi:alginate O-acetyltransferase complex protein AlgI